MRSSQKVAPNCTYVNTLCVFVICSSSFLHIRSVCAHEPAGRKVPNRIIESVYLFVTACVIRTQWDFTPVFRIRVSVNG